MFQLPSLVAAFSFAQNAGQWSFGAGGNFVAPGAEDKDFKARPGKHCSDCAYRSICDFAPKK